ncbi:hypothetical protein Salat_1174300 [Sesamum alatum]|uniref:Uncharacterized protein n=1 Tax=Sesamum alatum TaxID=300844 RepID=A0AAE1YEP9_9LAMI|nr:hypothetical protein Salat_1174300 [Sesamum alatum]
MWVKVEQGLRSWVEPCVQSTGDRAEPRKSTHKERRAGSEPNVSSPMLKSKLASYLSRPIILANKGILSSEASTYHLRFYCTFPSPYQLLGNSPVSLLFLILMSGESSDSSESGGSSKSSSSSSSSGTLGSSSSALSSPMARMDAPTCERRVSPEVVVVPDPPPLRDEGVLTDAPLDARLFIASTVKYKDLPKIRRDYHIPLEYTLHLPDRDQSMHLPPGCLTVHLPLLEAGLRFPIDPRVANLTNHLRISPSQLVPNDIAARAAMMANEARQRQEELVAIARAAGVEVDLEPMDSPGVVRSPSPLDAVPPQRGMNPSQVSRGEGHPRKPTPPQSIVRTRPRDSAVKAQTDPSVGEESGRSCPPAPSPKRRRSDKGKEVEVEHVEIEESEEVVGVEEGMAAQSPVFMGIDAFSHLSPKTIDKSTQRLRVCYKHLDRARAEINQTLKLNTQLPPNEVPLVPDWQVSGNSSVFHNKPGETSFEMYKACLLPENQIALASLHHARLEMLGAHLHHQLAKVMHAMSLQCSFWRYDRDELQFWIENIEESNEILKAELSEVQAWYLNAEDRIKGLEVEKARLEKQASESQRAADALRSEVRNLKTEVEALKAREEKAFESGYRGVRVTM